MQSILAGLAVLWTTQAHALQCLRPDPVRSFQAAMVAPDTYVVLRGTVAEAEVLIPLPNDKTQPHPVPVWFVGDILTTAGFTESMEAPMTVQITCTGPWCGALLPETPMIAFARVQGGGYVIDAGPCATWAFQPDPLIEALLTSCIRGDACVPADVAE